MQSLSILCRTKSLIGTPICLTAGTVRLTCGPWNSDRMILKTIWPWWAGSLTTQKPAAQDGRVSSRRSCAEMRHWPHIYRSHLAMHWQEIHPWNACLSFMAQQVETARVRPWRRFLRSWETMERPPIRSSSARSLDPSMLPAPQKKWRALQVYALLTFPSRKRRSRLMRRWSRGWQEMTP